MKPNFENFPIGTKVQSFNKDGYFVMNACGTVIEHLGNGHAIIKTFDGYFFSTISQKHVFDIESIN